MANGRFDVNDPELREFFLRHEVAQAVDKLADAATPRWGRMRAQEMIEHLLWAVRAVNRSGARGVPCV